MAITISRSVGFEGSNRKADVTAVQEALKEAAALTLDAKLDPGDVDGDNGVGTEGAIEHFQRRIGMLRPDAVIDPDGRTIKRLNALLAIGGVKMTYPFKKRSTFAFFGEEAGMRAFSARRGGGKRAHAGIDLYFPDFTPVLAMADGIVTRGPYDFYLRTFAVEVDHGAFLARYGEIAPSDSPPVREGDEVERGQVIGKVGILKHKNGRRLDVPSMMLHLELYDKTETGKLTRAKGTSARSPHGVMYMRRKDLIDPSGFVTNARLPR